MTGHARPGRPWAIAGLVVLVATLSVVAAAATGPLPAGETDQTPTVDFAAGSTATVANVSYGTAGDVENVTVDLAGGTDGDVPVSAVDRVTVVLAAGGEPVTFESVSYDAHGTTVPVAAGDIDRVTVYAHTNESAPAGAEVDALLTLSNGSATQTLDTAGVQTVTGDTGFATGRVSDQDNLNVANATVVATRDGVTRRTTTAEDGTYVLELAPGDYDLRVEKRYYSAERREGVTVVANRTTTKNVVATREEGVVRVVVTPENATARADGTDAAVFTVTALDALDRPVEGVTVEASEPFPAFDATPAQATTNASGQATVRVTSRYATTTSFALFTFEGEDDTDPRPAGIATVTFVGEVDPAIERLAGPDRVTAGGPVTVNATLHNLGEVPVTDDAVLRLDADGDGFDADDPAVRRTVEYAAGERVNVSLTLPGEATAGLDGAVTYRLQTKDDSRTGTVTVTAASPPAEDESDDLRPGLARFDREGDSRIGYGDVVDAITAFRDGETVGGERVTYEEVRTLIVAFQSG